MSKTLYLEGKKYTVDGEVFEYIKNLESYSCKKESDTDKAKELKDLINNLVCEGRLTGYIPDEEETRYYCLYSLLVYTWQTPAILEQIIKESKSQKGK